MDAEATRLKELNRQMNQMSRMVETFDARLKALEGGHVPILDPKTQPAKQSYAKVTGPPVTPRIPSIAPPPKTILKSLKPGKAIIHSVPEKSEVQNLARGFLVQRANEVLEKLDAKVEGERIAIRAAQVLKSGDVCFFSKNKAHQKWLMENKHTWSKQVHPDLEATPSTFSVIAHGIPKDFNPLAASAITRLSVKNNFAEGDLLRPRPPQCFKCLKMGHFGQWCREKARCGKCGDEHVTKDCPEGIGGIKSCVLCKEGLKMKIEGIDSIDHTPFNVTCFFKKAWLKKKHNRSQ
ncbi:hypothetical protein PTTG_29494 [Puccinia triticina 1-1 BBBD Race 1]|uniref:CCHC-type domain-containing protein n=1 Tax=Puccinia triticina (isolate 1-1 / race 1 (BBBD)) TaxID=630390 RepID=A0A180G3M8_PUCT1|nr:hypothetical protein PTTG_29494 [Puccinia triticina 1-1 BBBD Race 1]